MEDLVGQYGVVGLTTPMPRCVSRVTGSWANHCFIVIPGGRIIEPWIPYVRVRPLSAYDGHQVMFSNSVMTSHQRKAIVTYAMTWVGARYDYLHFAGLALLHLLSWDVCRATRQAVLCSRMVALAGEAGGVDWTGGRRIEHVTPATLAQRLQYDHELAG